MAARCHIRIDNKKVRAIVDSGAATNIITNALRRQLGLKIENPSNTTFTMANGNRTPSLGKTRVELDIEDEIIPIIAQVIDSKEEDLILGNEFFAKTKGRIDFGTNTLTLRHRNKKIEVTLQYMKEREPEYEPEEEQEMFTFTEGTSPIYTIEEREAEIKKTLVTGEMNDEQKKELIEIIRENQKLCALSGEPLGKTSMVKHEVNTGDTEPINQRYYRVTDDKRKIIKDEVDKMLKDGVIRESKSAWASPVVLVTKKSGKPRFCIDYRKLNAHTITDAHPLPRIDELLEKFRKGKWFTSMDLAAGYWQVEMDEKDREKTAFTCHYGLYEFNVMPFGLKNAPPTFQRLMNKVFKDYLDDFVIVYIDDILIYSKTYEEHLKHIRMVFDKLKEANLAIKLKKCKFCVPNIEFLGHVVGRDGLKPDPNKIKKMKELKAPTDLTSLRAALGLFSYYRKFVKHFSKTAGPMTELMKKDKKFIWSDECKEAFETLKKKLTEAPVLGYPDYEQEFILFTDASGKGLGAVLAQKQDGKEIVIAYASRSLNAAEQNYPITEQECLAVKWAIDYFHKYLLMKHFTVVTDHSALKTLMSTQEPKARRARWIMELQQYDFTI